MGVSFPVWKQNVISYVQGDLSFSHTVGSVSYRVGGSEVDVEFIQERANDS